MQKMMATLARGAALAAAALGLAACSVDSQKAPALIGPSGFGQSVTLNAVPDRLPRDGQSQSVVTLTVRNESGQGVSGQRVTLGVNIGTLSQEDVVTGSDGSASFTITAPGPDSTGNIIQVYATAVAGNFDNTVTRSLSIAITGLQNSAPPVPQFTLSPESPGANEPVTFDATGTQDEGSACGDACSYAWDFGDGTMRTGAIVTHRFAQPGAYTVSLTVTDPGGASASRQQVVTVTNIAAPAVTISVAPNPPLAGQLATFTANVNVPAGRYITSYAWSFGDGTSQTTTSPSVTKTYMSQGIYVVTVTVTQDTGQTASASLQIALGSAVNATIVVSPSDPVAGQLVHFSATTPTAPDGASIPDSGFEWNFGDSEQSDGGRAQGRNVTHRYTRPGTYAVTLTITDSNGLVGVVREEVTVAGN